MSSIKVRVTESASYYGLSMRKFEEKCQLNRGCLSNMEENSTIGSDKLASIFDNCKELSLEWLLTGNGKMLQNYSKIEENCRVCEEKEKHLKTKDKLILKLEQENESLKSEINKIKKYFGEKPVSDVEAAVAEDSIDIDSE